MRHLVWPPTIQLIKTEPTAESRQSINCVVKMRMYPLSKYLIQFLEHLEIEKNRSPLTLRNYHFYLNRFVEWLGQAKKPNAITFEAVRQYRLWLNRLEDVHGDPLKKNTQNYHLIALRSFLKYLAKRDVKTLAPEKIELMKMPDREVSFLDGNEISRLLESPLRVANTSPEAILVKFRDKAILELLFSTGLRVSEAASLRRDRVDS